MCCMMSRRAIYAFLALSVLSAGVRADPSAHCEKVRRALAEMHAWVDEGPYGEAWREYLDSELLESELANGAKASPKTIRRVLGHYASGEEGLDLPRFDKVRKALEQWLEELSGPPLDGLPARARGAIAEFAPISRADVERLRTELRKAVTQLDARLEEDESEGPRWREYVLWKTLESELDRGDEADLSQLDKVFYRLDAGHEGLELPCFVRVRRALWDYSAAARAREDRQLRKNLADTLNSLAEQIESCDGPPTADRTAAFTEALQWLRSTRQGTDLIREIRRCFSRPNLLGRISADMIRTGINRSVDDTSPVEDVILGTTVSGTGRTTGRLGVRLVPNDRRAVIELALRGTTHSDTVGFNGPARIYSDGVTELRGQKKLRIDGTGIEVLPATSTAETSTTTRCIGLDRGGRLVERIAWKRVCAQKCEAERIASSRAEQRLDDRLDEEVRRAMEESEQAPAGKLGTFLGQRAWFPGQVRTATTRDAVWFVALEAATGFLAAPGSPPPLADRIDLGLQVHESMINNWSVRALEGLILTEDRLNRTILEILGKYPEGYQPDKNSEPWAIRFAYQRPIFVSFTEGKFRLTIRGEYFSKGDRDYPAMDVTAEYAVLQTETGPKATRLGDLRIFPPDFEPDSGQQLTVEEQITRDMLERRFEKLLPKQIVPESRTLPGSLGKAGPMKLVQWELREGWMVVGWRRAPDEAVHP